MPTRFSHSSLFDGGNLRSNPHHLYPVRCESLTLSRQSAREDRSADCSCVQGERICGRKLEAALAAEKKKKKTISRCWVLQWPGRRPAAIFDQEGQGTPEPPISQLSESRAALYAFWRDKTFEDTKGIYLRTNSESVSIQEGEHFNATEIGKGSNNREKKPLWLKGVSPMSLQFEAPD